MTYELKLTPLHSEFGAEVSGIQLNSNVDEAQFREVQFAAEKYSLLLIRSQQWNEAEQLAFSGRFGVLEEEHVGYYTSGSINYLGYVGNVDPSGRVKHNNDRSVRSQTGNQMWHSDSSFRETPTKFSLLFAREVPPVGGDTEFVSGRSAFARLDAAMQRQIQPLIGIHDYIFSRTKVSEDAVSAGQRTFMRPVRQRLVRRNLVTRESNLFVGSHLREIEGLSQEKSEQLINVLMTETTRVQSVYRHRWCQGDVLIWDNRCLLHRGCGYDADNYRRCLTQTRVRGDGPSLAENVFEEKF